MRRGTTHASNPTRRYIILAAMVSATFAGWSRPAVAEDGATADQMIRALGKDAIAILTDQSLTVVQREEKFHRLLVQDFDIDLISRLSLGRFWRQASERQRSEYRQLFEIYVVKVYVARFNRYEGETFRVNAVRAGEGDDNVVLSQIDRPHDQPIRVDWKVRKEGDTFKVVDVAVEGVSMLAAQREEFTSVIQNGGGNVDTLLDQMRKRITTIS
jgi:phospholipid transport system substrate-binding protein